MSRIITFYSYKGGVGRTFALANISILLARNGARVLILDWDLEAPGLHRYFQTFLTPDDLDNEGLIGLLWDAIASDTPDWRPYVRQIPITPSTTGELSLIYSGDRKQSYSHRVRSFDWKAFFEKHKGGNILETWRAEWKTTYDYILIDSRTGITDSGGVCTIFLPDILVLVFTTNEQSFAGGIQVATQVQRARRGLSVPRPPVTVLPILGRFDGREELDEAVSWLKRCSSDLAEFYADWLPKTLVPRQIIELTKIPYIPKFSFGEPIPVHTHSIRDPEWPGYYLNNIARLIETDFNAAAQIIAPEGLASVPEPETDVARYSRTALSFYGFDTEGLVQILVRQGENNIRIVTGYAISTDLVLTAQSIYPVENVGQDLEIHIRWYDQSGRLACLLRGNNIVWRGGQDLDAMLIRCPDRKQSGTWPMLSNERSLDGVRWTSAGFTRVINGHNRNEEMRFISGRIYPATSKENSLELGFEVAPYEIEPSVMVSGCPVIVNGKISGVISCVEHLRPHSRRLRATPMWRLLENSRFLELTGYEDRMLLRGKMKRKITDILRRSTRVQEELGRRVGITSAEQEEVPEIIADVIMKMDIESVLKHANAVHRVYVDAEDASSAKSVRDIVVRILPLAADYRSIEIIRRAQNDIGKTLINLPVATKMAAEVTMAAFDKREVKFGSCAPGEHFPEAELSIGLPPEWGMGGPEHAEYLMHEYLIHRFTDMTFRGRFSNDVLRTVVADELSYLGQSGSTWYVVLSSNSEVDQWLISKSIVAHWQMSYPSLVFIMLEDKPDRIVYEMRMFRPASEIVKAV